MTNHQEHSTAADLVREGRRALKAADIESAQLDAEILLRETLEISRTELYLRFPEPVHPEDKRRFRELIARRAAGEPVAYITGRRAFYGCEFRVSDAVLIPRPETEYLVEWALAWLGKHEHERATIVDVGTGSGAIAISVALESGGAHTVVGNDVSMKALNVAAENRHAHGASVELVAGSLLDWLGTPVDLILANLPYLRPDQAHSGIEREPPLALFSGQDGFALSRACLMQAATRLQSPGGLTMEIDPEQASMAYDVATGCFPDARINVLKDLAGLERYLTVERD